MKLIGNAGIRLPIIVFVMSFIVESGLACTCAPPDPAKSINQLVEEARKHSKAVFTGKVLGIDKKPGKYDLAVRFAVDDSWKGITSKKVIVYTGRGGGDCGYRFEVGQQYLVYAYKHDSASLETNICQRTAGLTAAAEDLKVLGRKKPANEKTPPTKAKNQKKPANGKPSPANAKNQTPRGKR